MIDKVFAVIRKYNSKIHKLSPTKFITFKETFPKYSGVYVIYHKNEPLYVGTSKNIYNRFMRQHLSRRDSPASSAFRSKLHRKKRIQYENIRKWVIKNCVFKFIEIKDYDDSILFEAFLIKTWRKKYSGLLNDKKY